MILEEQRFLHEDLERLEQGISDRVLDEPKQLRERLAQDHQISGFLGRIQQQSQRLLEIYQDAEGGRKREIQTISTGDPFDEFYKQLDEMKDFHRRYPNEPIENLERVYKKDTGDGDALLSEIDNMFTGEEAYGRFLDLTALHDEYLNLPSVKRLTYLQYLDIFDHFLPPQCPVKRVDKNTDQYFHYLGNLTSYLESFLRRTKPLENFDALRAQIDADFDQAWTAGKLPGWTVEGSAAGPGRPSGGGETAAGRWCPDCEKDFTNENVYKNHLTGKKHLKAAEARKALASEDGRSGDAPNEHINGHSHGPGAGASLRRLKERAIAEREFRIQQLAAARDQERRDSRINVERKQGMTERERQTELDALFAPATEVGGGGKTKAHDDSDSDDEAEKIYNPLKLPLAWDGKPIPYWLYKLHGLGVEFACEICGNFVYMGRRAFDKHFNEGRHIYGLRCLGVTNTALFREITGIEDALKLWDKIQRDKKKEKAAVDNVVQMEDAEGNVMPEKVYYDLQKQGLL
ncbi:MAG: hypothetical protein M1826_005952 [Phylliscum demangeonii]|nr:MAG: hypothetical protein M1826_005952 [Phylliscum demangeonii]